VFHADKLFRTRLGVGMPNEFCARETQARVL
jgi:hypothetical protein